VVLSVEYLILSYLVLWFIGISINISIDGRIRISGFVGLG